MAGTICAKTRFALLPGRDDLFDPLVFGFLPMSTPVSPLAPTDVLLAVMDKGTTVAGVFTQSKCPSAPVEWCRAKLSGGRSSKGGFAGALVVNSGNANAFTGKTGRQATTLTASIAAKALGCSPNEVFLASTGVIGEPLDATKFNGVLGTPD